MELDNQLKLGHLLFKERKCKTCQEQKSLVDDFYKIRKGSGVSSYSYECKECSKKRVIKNRENKNYRTKWEYPDW